MLIAAFLAIAFLAFALASVQRVPVALVVCIIWMSFGILFFSILAAAFH